jgi:hypothetical protein
MTRLFETSQLTSSSHIKTIQCLQTCLCDCEPRFDCFAVVNEIYFVVAGNSNASRILKFSSQLQNGFPFLGQHQNAEGVTFQEAVKRNRHTHLSICH